VISSIRSQPPMIADELRRQADIFLDIVDLESRIARQLPADHPRNRVPEDDGDEDIDFDEEEDEEFYEEEGA
jgi:hypothetical protein